jgi:hypothetical protein
MWSLDENRKQVPDYDAIAPRGLMRTDFFRSNYAWYISFNPNKCTSQSGFPIFVDGREHG